MRARSVRTRRPSPLRVAPRGVEPETRGGEVENRQHQRFPREFAEALVAQG
jgi:hypothetical protein